MQNSDCDFLIYGFYTPSVCICMNDSLILQFIHKVVFKIHFFKSHSLLSLNLLDIKRKYTCIIGSTYSICSQIRTIVVVSYNPLQYTVYILHFLKLIKSKSQLTNLCQNRIIFRLFCLEIIGRIVPIQVSCPI